MANSLCATLDSNVESGCGRKSKGEFNGLLFSTKKQTALDPTSDFTDKSTIQALMQQTLANGRLVQMQESDSLEAGEPTVEDAESNNGNYKLRQTPRQDILDFHTSECGQKSILTAFEDGVEGYIWRLTEKNELIGKDNGSGSIDQIKAFISAVYLPQVDTSPDRVRVYVTYRENFEKNQLSYQPDWELSDLESITSVYLSDIVASDADDTIVFNQKTCNGSTVTGLTLDNYIFTAGGSVITPTGIVQDGAQVTATFAADTVTGNITVKLDGPENTAENYETVKIYTATAS